MHFRLKGIIYLSLIILFAASLPQHLVNAQTDDLILEAKQQWDTYLVGGTCIPGGSNLFASDVDGDGVVELVTGGIRYDANGSFATGDAPLRIWNWDGQTVNLEVAQNWKGTINCVYSADLDSDGTVEIITAGLTRNETGQATTALKIWHFNNQQLTFITQYEQISVNSLVVANLDSDRTPEIITVGGYSNASIVSGQLCIWHFENESLTLIRRFILDDADVRRVNCVYAADLNKDGNVEIITAGYSADLNSSKGQLCVWQCIGQELILKSNQQWQRTEGYALTISGSVQGNTVVNSVKSEDLDGDGVEEIVTGGFSYDGVNVTAQIRIWNWNQETLILRINHEWAADYLNEVKCVAVGDVDGDSKIDLVTSGVVCTKGSFSANVSVSEMAQLRVWGWDGEVLTLKHTTDWVTDEGVCAWNVATADLNNDGPKEIISVGCSYLSALCDPDMRIWSIPIANSKNTDFPPTLYTAIAVAIVVTAAILISFWRLKIRKSTRTN
jgi:hypothetical protein